MDFPEHVEQEIAWYIDRDRESRALVARHEAGVATEDDLAEALFLEHELATLQIALYRIGVPHERLFPDA